MKNLLLLLISISILSFATAQGNCDAEVLPVKSSFEETISESNFESHDIHFRGEVLKVKENINSFSWDMMPISSKFQNGYFGWIQFYETPSQTIQNEFKNKGLELIQYLSGKVYVCYFPKNTSIQYLKESGVRAIVPVEGRFKCSEALGNESYPDYARDGSNILIVLHYHDQLNSVDIIGELSKHDAVVRQEYKRSNNLELSIPVEALESIVNLPFVNYVDLVSPPAIGHDDRGRGLLNSSNLDTQTPSGRNYTGEGIGVLVRDWGIIGPHIDFTGRLDNLETEQFNAWENHGDGVAGVMAGSGNLDPTRRGMAAGAFIYNSYQADPFIDPGTAELFHSGQVQISNTSAGLGCQSAYSLTSMNVDQQIKDVPTLLHVLSAGNSGNSECEYAPIGWGNLGGPDKSCKNTITAANVTFDGLIHSTSSRGPTSDGRIKPDLAGMGTGHWSTDEDNSYYVFGGTSAAAPAIAGVAAQLYEAYGIENNGEFPQSALIKAIMLNTATDAGNIGPDFIYGWGIVNALRAVISIENGTYLSETIAQGETNSHTITIPTGATQVKVMLYWSDVPGAANSNTNLVNDLDLVVNDTENNALLPWILDSTFDPVALNSPATNGVDRLNNMEQVLINNPAAGDYTLDISGFNIPMGPQEYFIVYDVITDNVTLAYPNGGESFVPGETEVIYWDATNTTEDFDLEYSIDNGISWTSIATVSNNQKYFAWSIPNEVTGSALIKVTSGSFTDTSDADFSMSGQVEAFAFSQICPEEVTFTWDELESAESYDVYILGSKFMEVVGSSTSTSITVTVPDPTIELWAAIVAKNESKDWTSRRTVAISSGGGFLDCQLANDIAMTGISNDASDFVTICSATDDVLISATVRNDGTEPQSNFDVSYQLDQLTPIVETFTGTLIPGQQEEFDFATPLTISDNDNYTLSVSSNLSTDENSFNNISTLEFSALSSGTALDYQESFDNTGITPIGWSVVNPDNNRTWIEANAIIGIDGNLTTAAFVDNYNYDASGQDDFLVTEFFDLTSNSPAILNFDLAKVQWNENLFDGLRVEISVDCGNSFTSIYSKTGDSLQTFIDNNQTPVWKPSNGSDWRTEEVDLASYVGETVILRFVNECGYGNSTYIDNISLNQTLVSTENVPLKDIILYPNPATETLFLKIENQISDETSVVITNSLGQRTYFRELESTDLVIDVATYKSGIYFLTINSMGNSLTKKIFIE